MKSCGSCGNRFELEKGMSFCVRFPPSVKANGKSAYPQVEETTWACGEYRMMDIKKQTGGVK